MPDLTRKESWALTGVLGAIAVMTTIDVATDVAAGSSWSHVAAEIAAIAILLAVLGWLWKGKVAEMKAAVQTSERRVHELAQEAARWRAQVAELKPSLSEAIDKQFEDWHLTHAEREIARLILKGLANKEIASVRSSTEHTIKQQVNAIYRKAGLGSRAQLAAFFLEDLF